jgi:DNA polymerase IV
VATHGVYRPRRLDREPAGCPCAEVTRHQHTESVDDLLSGSYPGVWENGLSSPLFPAQAASHLYTSGVRKIIHVDMDAFFASVEVRERPSLRGRPVVVGGDPRGRGVVAAASYEARTFGVHSAMPCAEAQRRCPGVVFVRPNLPLYREVSRQVFEIFRDVTPLVEGLSLDEAYLDVTQNTLDEPLAGKVAIAIKRRIQEEVRLTASAGVAPNKLVAKIASGMNKPDGLTIIPPEAVDAFVADLAVERLWGVGPATARRLRGAGLRTARDIRDRTPDQLGALLGQHGLWLHRLAHGDDPRPVRTDRTPKSRGAETTFTGDIVDTERLARVIGELAGSVSRSLTRIERPGRTVTLKVRYADFTTITRSVTLRQATADPAIIATQATQLLEEGTDAGERPVRLVGVSVANLVEPGEPVQLALTLPPGPPLSAAS